MDEAMEAARKRNAMRLDEAFQHLRERNYESDTKSAAEMLEIRKAELELARGREARLGAEQPAPRNIDPLSPEGIAAAAEKERRVGEAKATVEAQYPGAPKEPDGLDQKIPPKTLALLTKKAGLKDGDLDGLTFREWNAMENDPQEDILKQLRIIAAQRDVAEHEPPKLKAARKALERAEKDLADFKDRVATASRMTPMDPNAIKTRKAELEAGVSSAKGVVSAEEKAAEASTPRMGEGRIPPPPGDPMKVKALQDAGWTWDGVKWNEPGVK